MWYIRNGFMWRGHRAIGTIMGLFIKERIISWKLFRSRSASWLGLFFFRMRRLGSVAKPLQPAHCVGVWVFEVQIVGWEKGGALVDDVMGGLFLGSPWAGCWWAQTPALHIGVESANIGFVIWTMCVHKHCKRVAVGYAQLQADYEQTLLSLAHF